MKERLQKILANNGLCSRRSAERFISEGKVTINGITARLGDSADIEIDEIEFCGKKVFADNVDKIYIMLNKPIGVVTTLNDEKGRKNISNLVSCGKRVYPIGRLDLNSEGLLIITNDGQLANKLMHPKHNVRKTYIVNVKGNIKKIENLSKAMDIDGYIIKPAIVTIINAFNDEATVKISIAEGRNRQIRKMCDKCGFKVKKLKRIAIGKLLIDESLKPGSWRMLNKEEINYLISL